MFIRFNEAKATQAAAVLLERVGREMNHMKLIKLMYLADREALLRWGRSISTDRHCSLPRGPVLSKVLNLINDEPSPVESSIWASTISSIPSYKVRLNFEIEKNDLSLAEIDVLNAVFNQFGHMNQWELVDYTHTLPEWKDPNGSSIPIDYRDILKAGNKSEEAIGKISEEFEALTCFDEIFGN